MGVPDYELEQKSVRIVLNFRNEMDRAEFADIADLELTEDLVWWPRLS